MRKFTKIFAVILSVTVLFGALAIFAFADESAKKDLVIGAEGIYNTVNLDFEDLKVGDTAFQSGKSSYTNSKYGWNSALTPSDCSTIKIKEQSDDNEITNKYLNFSRNEDVEATKFYWEFCTGAYTKVSNRAQNESVHEYAYITIDFDISCDEYMYELNGETLYGTEIPEGAENVRLAYPNELGFYQIMRSNDSAAATYQQVYVIYNADTNLWYLSPNDKVFQATDIPLSNIAGAWNHFTATVVGDPRLSGDSMMRYYLNGQMVSEKKVNTNGCTDVLVDSFRFDVNATVLASGAHFSFALDNFTTNYYPIGYTSGDEYGIDDLYASDNYASINLSECKDVVYNEQYSYVGTPTPFAAILEHADGTQEKYYNAMASLKYIKDSDVITINSNLLNYTPNDDISLLTIIPNGESRFDLSDDAKELFKVQHTGDRYTIIRAEENSMKLKWYDSQGEDRKLIKEQFILPLMTPNVNAEVLRICGKIDRTSDNPTIQILRDWQWDINGDGIADGASVSTLTLADINRYIELGYTELSVVPVFETMPLYFLIEEGDATGDADAKLYIPDYDYEKFASAEIDTLINAIKAIKINEATVTLYADYKLARNKVITVPAAVELNLDLNGHSVFQTDYTTSSNQVSFFLVNEETTFNVYSSRPGAYLAQGVVDSNADVSKGEFAGVYGHGIIAANDVDALTINLGEKLDKNGNVVASADNLAVYGSKLLHLVGTATANPNAKKVVININGGSYFSIGSTANAMIPVSEMDMEINVVNAILYAANGDAIFSSVSDKAHSAIINVKNSKLISANGTSVIKGLSDKCEVYIESSIVSALNDFSASVMLGSYNKLAGGVDVSVVSLANGVAIVSANNESAKDSESITYPVNFADMYSTGSLDTAWTALDTVDVEFEYSYLTIAPADDFASMGAPFSNVCVVDWLAPDGTVYATTYWVVGSQIECIGLDAFDEVVTGNGWYNLVYASWENVADPSNFVANGTNMSFKPMATGVTPALDVKVSVEIFENVAFNIYLPAAADKVTFIGFFKGDKKLDADTYNDVTVDGISGFYQLIGMIANDSFVSDEITVEFAVEGFEETFKKVVSVYLLEYAAKVDSLYGCGTDESALIYAMMQYKYELYLMAVNGNVDDAIDLPVQDYLSSHGAECTCGQIGEIAKVDVDSSALDGLVKDVVYGVKFNDAGVASFAISVIVPDGANVTDVSASIDDNIQKLLAKSCDGYTEYIWSGLPVELVCQVLTISVTTDNGTVSGEYSLANQALENDFAAAMYIISKATADNK